MSSRIDRDVDHDFWQVIVLILMIAAAGLTVDCPVSARPKHYEILMSEPFPKHCEYWTESHWDFCDFICRKRTKSPMPYCLDGQCFCCEEDDEYCDPGC